MCGQDSICPVVIRYRDPSGLPFQVYMWIWGLWEPRTPRSREASLREDVRGCLPSTSCWVYSLGFPFRPNVADADPRGPSLLADALRGCSSTHAFSRTFADRGPI